MKEDREVETGDGERFAQENGLSFLETSAMTGENVQEVFQVLSKIILNKAEGGNWVFIVRKVMLVRSY